MDALILGGPKFLGRGMIDAALAAGHNVTIFNRGMTNPDLYPEIEKLRGDRDGSLDALKRRKWDFVIDDAGYLPRIVRQSAELLKDAVGRYVFVSTVSVYKDFEVEGIDESYAVGLLEDESVEEIENYYGQLKALCENVVRETYGDRALIIRPGLIVGPHDPTHRFTYWLTRAALGGEMLAPSSSDYEMKVIDMRDLAEWTLRMAINGASGAYNASGPDYTLTLGEILECARDVSGSDTQFVWANTKFLLSNGVTPWSDMPLWAPAAIKVHQVSIAKALTAGLTFRPLEETVRDTLEWARTQPTPDPLPVGLTPEREAELIAAWRAEE